MSEPVAELRERLQRYPADRHPLKHATAQFHLAGLHLAAGELDEAEEAFAVAAALFRARGAHPEEAKALNGLGATLREAGRLELAARALAHAAAGLADAGLTLEEGAARFNLGLVLNDAGRAAEAATAFARAADLLEPALVPGQAAAAVRELGVTLLGLGRLDEARSALTGAVSLADRARDAAGRSAAANALGLVDLAAGRPEEAQSAFADAAACSPRAVRPAAFAMAKANLALAAERAGRPPHARLAARQALAAEEAPQPVRAQAREVLDRLGDDRADLRTVLDDEPTEEGRVRIAREELERSAGAGAADLQDDMDAWVDAHTASRLEPVDVAEVWLAGLLELPPEALERIVRRAVAVALERDAETRETFRTAVTRAMARFGIPQWMRLQDVFASAASDAGDAEAWR